MRVLVSLIAVLAALALPGVAQAGCSPAHVVEQSTPPATTASVPQSTPAPTKPAPGG